MDENHGLIAESVRNFWDRYIQLLDNNGINIKFRRWYVKRVEEYIQYYYDERLRKHTPHHVTSFLTEAALQTGLSDWQFRQVVDAIRILFCDLLALKWCGEVDWNYWSECSDRLPIQHATLARESVAPTEGVDAESRLSSKQAREYFSDAITRVVTEIRTRGYSIRTEQSYERWIVRFVSYQPHEKLDEIAGEGVRHYLEHIVLHDNVAASTQN